MSGLGARASLLGRFQCALVRSCHPHLGSSLHTLRANVATLSQAQSPLLKLCHCLETGGALRQAVCTSIPATSWQARALAASTSISYEPVWRALAAAVTSQEPPAEVTIAINRRLNLTMGVATSTSETPNGGVQQLRSQCRSSLRSAEALVSAPRRQLEGSPSILAKPSRRLAACRSGAGRVIVSAPHGSEVAAASSSSEE